MEVCVDNIQSAMNGELGGGMRVELCSALSEGGLTPSLGVLDVVKQLISIPVFCMVRPRSGRDFIYSEYEIEAMVNDVKLFKEHGADGLVFGCLTEEQTIDVNACQKLLEHAAPLPVTFHRAFDYVADPYTALETLIELGFKRILTSGKAETVEYGVDLVKELNELANNRIIIMPGGGINEFNLMSILTETKATEFHGSAKGIVHSLHVNSERQLKTGSQISLMTNTIPLSFVTDIDNVKRLVAIYKRVRSELKH